MKNIPNGVAINIPTILFRPNKMEIWSKGELIESGEVTGFAELWAEVIENNTGLERFQITVRIRGAIKEKIYNYIDQRFYLDTAYAIDDRIIVAIIPKTSNIKENTSYLAFINTAPYYTREQFNFDVNIPFCCSLFLDDNNEPFKVSYSNALNQTLIEFT
jgi:hypothetical protein